MWLDWVSNPGPLAFESDALPTELCGSAQKRVLLKSIDVRRTACVHAQDNHINLKLKKEAYAPRHKCE